MDEAADAIERLAAEQDDSVKMLHAMGDEIDKNEAALAAKDAEIARLRDALVEIAASEPCYGDVMMHLARAALNPRPLADKPKDPPR